MPPHTRSEHILHPNDRAVDLDNLGALIRLVVRYPVVEESDELQEQGVEEQPLGLESARKRVKVEREEEEMTEGLGNGIKVKEEEPTKNEIPSAQTDIPLSTSQPSNPFPDHLHLCNHTFVYNYSNPSPELEVVPQTMKPIMDLLCSEHVDQYLQNQPDNQRELNLGRVSIKMKDGPCVTSDELWSNLKEDVKEEEESTGRLGKRKRKDQGPKGVNRLKHSALGIFSGSMATQSEWAVENGYSQTDQTWFSALVYLALQPESCLALTGDLSLILPDEPLDLTNVESTIYPSPLPLFSLKMTFHVYLHNPPSGAYPPANSSTLQLQHLFFTSIISPPSAPPNYANHHNHTTLPFFYENLKPAPSFEEGEEEEAVRPEGLVPTLLPYQKRTVRWLLSREGKRLDGRALKDCARPGDESFGWEELRLPLRVAPPLGIIVDEETSTKEEEQGESIWFNRVSGLIVKREADVKSVSEDWSLALVKGGMLCEEMGLGKTLEVIALILLNPRTNEIKTSFDESAQLSIRQSKASLIIAPTTLVQQWQNEIKALSPGLKVFVYEGYKKLPFEVTTEAYIEGSKSLGSSKSSLSKAKNDAEESVQGEGRWWNFLDDGDYDIVIVTYSVLMADLDVAKHHAPRPRRNQVDYDRTPKARSPLVMVEWWRVVMDEVQLQGDGKAASMVSLLPRENSFAVSGTPAKDQVKDLQHALKFLRVPAFGSSTKLWTRLLTPALASNFVKLFDTISTRATKAQVQNELKIPSQMRYLFPIHLSAIEQHYYGDTFNRALQDLGFDFDGNGFELDLNKARNWVHTLREIATHFQVGDLTNNRVSTERFRLGANLLGVDEVLQKMIWAGDNEILTLQYKLGVPNKQLNLQISYGFLLCSSLTDHRMEDPVPPAEPILEDNERLRPKFDEVSCLKAQTVYEKALDSVSKILAKLENNLGSKSVEDAADSGEQAGSAQRIADFKLTKHRAIFFMANFHHSMKHTDLETTYYEMAEEIRLDILSRSTKNVVKAIKEIKTCDQIVHQKDFVIGSCEIGGIRSREICKKANEIIKLLRSNSTLLWSWRTKIVDLLTTPINKKEDATKEAGDGDTDIYAQDLIGQTELEAYFQAYSAAIADRREMVQETRTELAIVDSRVTKERKSKNSRKDSKAEVVPTQELGKKLMAERAALRLNPERPKHGEELRSCLKTHFFALNDITMMTGNQIERTIAETEGNKLHQTITNQTKSISQLEKELDLFRTAYNARVEYFKQLQQISDSVVDIAYDHKENSRLNIRKLLLGDEAKETELIVKINNISALQRYRTTIHSGLMDADRSCVICLEDSWVRGILLECSHMFCQDCYRTLVRTSLMCPVCRTPINPTVAHRVIFDPKPASSKEERKQPAVQETSKTSGKKPPSKPSGRKPNVLSDLNIVSDEEISEVLQIPFFGDWGSKINTMIRHLLYLRKGDFGSKAVIFTAFPDALGILEKALKSNGIRYVGSSSGPKAATQFKSDPNIQCYLLSGKKESAGLTLTEARYVFLMEPTVSPSFELQAIGRIERIGQKQTTKVYCYFSTDTLDESVVRLTAFKGQSIYKKQSIGSSLPINATRPDEGVDGHLTKQTKKAGDFIALSDDLAALLFPDRHLPTHGEEEISPAPAPVSYSSSGRDPRFTGSDGQPIAGPSRIC